MAREPDNLVLELLRGIRATLDEHTRLHEEHRRMHQEHRQSFAELRDTLTTTNNNATYAAGFAVLGRRDNDMTSARVTSLEQRVKRLEEQVEP